MTFQAKSANALPLHYWNWVVDT